MKLHNLSYF